MKGKFLFAALVSMILSACTNNELMLDETKKGREIRFAVAAQTAQTRAEHDNDGPYNGKLLIWAWVNGTDEIIIPGDEYDAATFAFSGNRIYYYPVNGNSVDFLAVPKDAVDKEYFTTPTRDENGKTTFVFNSGHEDHNSGAHSVDLMTSEVITQNTGVVKILLRHLTAKLNVRILQNQRQNDATICSVTLNKLEFIDLKNTGSVSLTQNWSAVNGGDDCLWTTIDENKTCNWSILTDASDDNHQLASTDISQETTEFNTSTPHHVVPQELVDDGQKLYLEYSVLTKYKNDQPSVTQDFRKTIELVDIPEIPKWAMNKNITYIIYINPLEEHHKITFDVNVEAWGNLNGETTIVPSESTELP